MKRWVVHKSQPHDVYIGRPSKWGNPFVLGRDGNRAEVIRKYECSLSPELIAQAKKELRGKVLACWCAPLACHGDVLARIANEGIPCDCAVPDPCYGTSRCIGR